MSQLNDDYLSLYELFSASVERLREDDSRHNVVIYHPDVYIELAKENIKLRKDVQRLQVSERKYHDELIYNMNMIDKLRWCAATLETFGVSLPFRIDGSPV